MPVAGLQSPTGSTVHNSKEPPHYEQYIIPLRFASSSHPGDDAMSWQTPYIVNGYGFLFISRDFGGDGGIIVSPFDDLSDPELLQALRTCQEAYPYVAALHDIYDWGCDPSEPASQRNWQLLQDNPYFDIPDDVIHAFTAPPKPAPVPQPKAKRRDPGFVYLLREINGAHYKIGKTKNPESRAKTFGVQLPYSVEYECVINTPSMSVLETALHERYAHKRINGEWFALDPEDVEYIKALVGVE